MFHFFLHHLIPGLDNAFFDQLFAFGMDEMEGETGGFLNVGFGFVLSYLRKTGQLDGDKARTSGLNDGFGNTQTVNAFAQHFDGLFGQTLPLGLILQGILSGVGVLFFNVA